MRQTAGVKDEVYFHPEQIKYLERTFPEKVVLPSTTEAEMRFHGGQRNIIKFIASKVKLNA